MRHKYQYPYQTQINKRYSIWKIIGYILLFIFLAICANGVWVGIKSIPQPAIATEPLQVITNDYYTTTAITSAYTKWETCPKTECITASGTRPKKNVSVACPRNIPFRTKIEIDGQEYRCEDYTHKKFDGRYDIYFGDDKQSWIMAKEYGLQTHLIKIYY